MVFCLESIDAQQIPDNIVNKIKFREIGPTRQGGRYVDFAVVDKSPKVIYAATASGGLWKTVNNGQSWNPIFDNENIISIGAVAVGAVGANGTNGTNASDDDVNATNASNTSNGTGTAEQQLSFFEALGVSVSAVEYGVSGKMSMIAADTNQAPAKETSYIDPWNNTIV